MAATWNKNPSLFSDKLGPVVATGSAARSFGVYAAVAIVAAGLSQYGCVSNCPRLTRRRVSPVLAFCAVPNRVMQYVPMRMSDDRHGLRCRSALLRFLHLPYVGVVGV